MKKPSEDVLKRYFESRATKAESIEVIEWLGTNKGQNYYNSLLESKIENIEIHSESNSNPEQADMLEKVYQKIDEITLPQRNQNRKFSYAIAAAISAIVIVVFTITNPFEQHQIVYSTTYGETKTLDLDDESKIILNANSELTFTEKRIVKLKGEAFFYVTHLTDHSPFIVITDELEVNVLGTEFNVNSRRSETEVVLNTGSVALQLFSETDTTQISMLPGDYIAFSENDITYTKKRVDTESHTSWRNNLLVFDHTPFSEILVLLEDNYGLQVDVQDKEILNLEFTAELPADDVDLLLKLMEKSFHISIIKTKNKVLMEKT
jgi:transmembrane sensor